ncbi:MAG: hypothetical protein GY703_08760 [Gammaproteobacteria bacterium]|nr:hypothetical protein [Gammaproteobacteria bacterium]
MAKLNLIREESNRQRGVGLVELLIAMALGLVLTLGIMEIFIGSKQAYQTQDALSRIQENGRYAMAELSRNIRMAGFQGCGNLGEIETIVHANNLPGSGGFSVADAVRGYEYDKSSDEFAPPHLNAGMAPAPNRSTDLISISRAGECGAYLSGAMDPDAPPNLVTVENTCAFNSGEPVIITDCTTAELFVADVNEAGDELRFNTANTRTELSRAYSDDARVFRFEQVDYFIQENNFGRLALFRRINGGPSQEMVEGIHESDPDEVRELQVEYGEDTTGDRSVDVYSAAPAVADWSNVSSVRLRLFLRSRQGNITLDNEPLSQVMTSTIGIRNRLP